MGSPKPHEKDTLKQQLSNSNSNETAYLNNLRANECYTQKDLTQCLKHLIAYFTSGLNAKLEAVTKTANNEDSKSGVLEKLESSVNDEMLAKFTAAVHSSVSSTNLATSLLTNNEYFMALLARNQSVLDWVSSLLAQIKDKDQESVKHWSINHTIAIYLNNLALVHFSAQKYNLSSLYIQKSLEQNEIFIQKYLTTSESNSNQSSTLGIFSSILFLV